jgi:FkbM family methyltransferase
MFHGTYIGNNRMLIKTAWGIRLIASCDDMSLMPTLMVDGVIEVGFTNWIRRNTEQFAGKTVIDVGANIGYFTALLACVSDKVYAYEANPEVYKLLMDNIYLSQLQDKVVPFNKAVTSFSDILLGFYVSKKYQGNSSLVSHTAEYREQFATDEFDKIVVNTDTLDRYKDEEIFLVKIDVEGGELDVLDGMDNLIVNNKVKNIVLEFNRNMLGANADNLLMQLEIYRKQFGALFYTFTPEGETRFTLLENIASQDYIDNILVRF